jgi:predicted PurR-regulated permease PerM
MLQLNLKDRIQIYQLVAALTAVTLLLIGCMTILKPFFAAMLLSTIFTLATWPAFMWLQHKLKHRTQLAAGLMTLFLAACFIAPLFIIGTSVADNYTQVHDAVVAFLGTDPKITAETLSHFPYIGSYLSEFWLFSMQDRQHMLHMLEKYGPSSDTLLTAGGTIFRGLMDITLGVIISYFFFRHGLHAAVRVRAIIEKFGGEHGQNLLKISKNTLIGVVYGILGTALLQGLLAAIGFWVVGIPGATFLGLLTFFLSLVPMGPPLLWGPAAIWLFSEDHSGKAIFLFVWGIGVIASVDNFMKPYFISRGSDMPLLLVLLGIMGGAIGFGFIGIFIGPTLLALAYSLVVEWSTTRGKATEHFSHAGHQHPHENPHIPA